MRSYDYKTIPYDHQRSALEESWAAEYYALFMEMGTGKTKVAIDNMAVLFEAGKITAVLVVAPKGVYDNWAKSEIQTHLPERIERHVMRWRPVKTQTYETELKDFILADMPLTLKIFVMNIEAFSTPRGAGIAKAFLKYNRRQHGYRGREHDNQKPQGRSDQEHCSPAQHVKISTDFDGFPCHQKPHGPLRAVRITG
jgi:hypothetical protein